MIGLRPARFTAGSTYSGRGNETHNERKKGEELMKHSLVWRIAGGAMVALISLNSQAQGSGAASAPAASAILDAKAVKAANRALQKDVVRTLSKTKGLRSSTVTVRANNGVVTLEGTVPEASQIELATHAAEGVTGVSAVKNTLTLSTF
jgi:hyperosmotically inducible periplasmic protein